MKKSSISVAVVLALTAFTVQVSAQEEKVIEVEGKGANFPIVKGEHKSIQEQKRNRRVDVFYEKMAEQVVAEDKGPAVVKGQFRMNVDSGGVIWAVEDPSIGDAVLTVSAPSYVGFNNNSVVKPVKFYIRSNYPAFISYYEVLIYNGSDVSLSKPLVRLKGDALSVTDIEWDGILPSQTNMRVGGELIYVLRAYAADGNYDETIYRNIQLVTPENAERSYIRLRDTLQREEGLNLGVQDALNRSLRDDSLKNNGLAKKNILLKGSRLRINGMDLTPSSKVLINKEIFSVDSKGKFTTDYIIPLGESRFDVEVNTKKGKFSKSFSYYIDGNYQVLVALADVTISKSKTSGSAAIKGADDKILSEGRLAFYGKKKINGNLTITAHADTEEKELKNIFKGFTNATPRDIFRVLNSEDYYPIYGDDSKVYRDVDTMGKFYARADWNKSQFLWGNFNTDFTGTQYSGYSRSLYGAGLAFNSIKTNKWGDSTTYLRAFASQEETAAAHIEFAGTGGSLYYLKHLNIIPGSDKILLDVKDPLTGLSKRRIKLIRNVDYEVNNIQGRIMLSTPLAQIVRRDDSLASTEPVSGYENRLIVDYEYLPTGFEAKDVSYGVRGKQWLGDYIAVGSTYVKEANGVSDLEIKGVDVTLQAGQNTFVKAEYAQTESYGLLSYYSDNGGMSFDQADVIDRDIKRKGSAKAVEARVDLQELGVTEKAANFGAWWNKEDAGYSTSGSRVNTLGGSPSISIGQGVTRYGADAKINISNDINLYGRNAIIKQGNKQYTERQITARYDVNDDVMLSAEIKSIQKKGDAIEPDSSGLLGILRYDHRLNDKLSAYVAGQLTLDNDDGNYKRNNRVIVGGRYAYGDNSSLGAEVSGGDRGWAAQVSANQKVTSNYSIYTAYTFADQPNDFDSLFSNAKRQGLTVGQRLNVSRGVSVYTESQLFKQHSGETSANNTLGVDYSLAHGWSVGMSVTQGAYKRLDGNQVRRLGSSAYITKKTENLDWITRFEWRKDSKAEQRRQYVFSSAANYKVDDEWNVAARINASRTEDKQSNLDEARFVESNLGFAYRPRFNTDWALFGRYTYTYNIAGSAQINSSGFDQKTHVFASEGIYKLSPNWEVGAKIALRTGEQKIVGSNGAWFDSKALFTALQARYNLMYKWNALAEYRMLKVKNGGAKHGALFAIERDIHKNFKLGIGYNFTSFSDDLTDLNYKHNGFFINIVGRY